MECLIISAEEERSVRVGYSSRNTGGGNIFFYLFWINQVAARGATNLLPGMQAQTGAQKDQSITAAVFL